MRLDDFIYELKREGWRGVHDAQWGNIAILHKKLFPVVAELEDRVKDLEDELFRTQERLYSVEEQLRLIDEGGNDE